MKDDIVEPAKFQSERDCTELLYADKNDCNISMHIPVSLKDKEEWAWYLSDLVDGGLYLAELQGLWIQKLEHIGGHRVDLIGHTSQGLSSEGLGLLQGFGGVISSLLN